MKNQLESLSVPELLRYYVEVLRELRRRGVIRTRNNPVGDYAEWLASRCLNLELLGNSNAGYDASDEDGVRYQIKGRSLTPENPSTQLGAIRNLDKQDFDYLVAILFNEDFTIRLVVRIPHVVIGDYARFMTHVNAHRLLLQGPLLADPRVQDITHMFTRFADTP